MADITLGEVVIRGERRAHRDFDREADVEQGLRALAGRIALEPGLTGIYTAVYFDRADPMDNWAWRPDGTLELLRDDAWAIAAIQKALEAH